MEITLVRDYFEEEQAIPTGHNGERVFWHWMSGRTDLWQRDENGDFSGYLEYDILLAKLEEWDRRDAEEEEDLIKQAFINIGTNGLMRDLSPIRIREKCSPFIFEIILSEEREFKRWIDLRQLIDYLLDNEKAVKKRVSKAKADSSAAMRAMNEDILQMRL